MAGGYMGKVLRVDLSEENMTPQSFSEETLRKYIGGSGLGAKILVDGRGVTVAGREGGYWVGPTVIDL